MKRQLQLNNGFKKWLNVPFFTDDANAYELVCNLGEKGKGCYFKVTATRADGVSITDIGQVSENGIISYTLASNMYGVEGELILRVQVLNGETALTEKILYAMVEVGERGTENPSTSQPAINKILLSLKDKADKTDISELQERLDSFDDSDKKIEEIVNDKLDSQDAMGRKGCGDGSGIITRDSVNTPTVPETIYYRLVNQNVPYEIIDGQVCYRFEHLLFTTASSREENGESISHIKYDETLYTYVDSWGSKRYTIFRNYTPDIEDGNPVTLVNPDDPMISAIKYEAYFNDENNIVSDRIRFTLAEGESSLSVGNKNNACQKNSLAMGFGNLTSGECGISMGGINLSRGKYSFSCGYGGRALGINSATLNEGGQALGYASLAFGDHCGAFGPYDVAGGYNSISSGIGNLSFGAKLTTKGKRTVNFGAGNYANCEDSVISGKNNTCEGNRSLVCGMSNSVKSPYSFVGGQSNELLDTSSTVLVMGNKNNILGTNALVVGSYNKQSGSHSSIIGPYNANSGNDGSLVVGKNNINSGGSSLVSGANNTCSGNYSFVSGNDSSITASGTNCLGSDNKSNYAHTQLIGRGLSAGAGHQVILGTGNEETSKDASVIIGAGTVDRTSLFNAVVVYRSNNRRGQTEISKPVLVSPSGKRYLLTVDDDGNLQTELVN